jgi:DNA-binding XRE family transcriptional regulator
MHITGKHLRELRIACRASTDGFANLLGLQSESLAEIEQTNKVLCKESTSALKSVLGLSDAQIELIHTLFDEQGVNKYRSRHRRLAEFMREKIVILIRERFEARQYLAALT